jgi:hypothetical protein
MRHSHAHINKNTMCDNSHMAYSAAFREYLRAEGRSSREWVKWYDRLREREREGGERMGEVVRQTEREGERERKENG